MANIASLLAEWEYREDMALAIVAGQLIPWLVALPIMLIIMMVLLGRELAPLNKLALALRMRDPDSEKTTKRDWRTQRSAATG